VEKGKKGGGVEEREEREGWEGKGREELFSKWAQAGRSVPAACIGKRRASLYFCSEMNNLYYFYQFALF